MGRKCVMSYVLFGSKQIELLYDYARDDGALVDLGIPDAGVLGRALSYY